jgi:hypothetical protein
VTLTLAYRQMDADTDRVSKKEEEERRHRYSQSRKATKQQVTQEDSLSKKFEVIPNQETSLWFMCCKFVK